MSAPAVTLVTGSSGFVGRVIVSRLAATGKNAIGLDPRPSPTTRVIDDLSDRARLRELIARETKFNVDTIVHAALVGKPARLDPLTDWPYVYVDDAAEAAMAACFSRERKQLAYFVAHPERVAPEDIAAACAAAGCPVRLEVD